MPWGSGTGVDTAIPWAVSGGSLQRAGAVVQSRTMVQTFLIFLMSLSSSLGVTVWVDWMRSLSLSRDAICDRNTGQLQGGAAVSRHRGVRGALRFLPGGRALPLRSLALWAISDPDVSERARGGGLSTWVPGSLGEAAPRSGLQAPLYIWGSPPSSPTTAPLFVGFYCGKTYIT